MMTTGEKKQQQFAVDTSSRTILQWAQGLLVLFFGLTVAHLGVALFLLSRLGTDTFTIFAQGLANVLGITVGTCHVGLCIMIMAVMLFTTKGYIKPGTVVCAFCGGWIIDLFVWLFGRWVNETSPMPVRILTMTAGCVILALGMSFVIQSDSGTGPNDLVAIVLSDKINQKRNIAFRWVRMGCDLVFVLTGTLLGGTLGIGTVAAVFLTGPVVQFFLPGSRRIIRKVFPGLETENT